MSNPNDPALRIDELRELLKECAPYLDELSDELQCQDADDDADEVRDLRERVDAALIALAEEERTRSET